MEADKQQVTDVLSALSYDMPKAQPCFVPLVCTPSKRLEHVHELLSEAPRPGSCSQSANHAVVPAAYAKFQLPRMVELLGTSSEYRMNIKVDAAERRVHLPAKCRLLPGSVRETLVDMAYSHATVTHSECVEGKVALVFGTQCPRWHVDRIDLRGVCTLFGPGTVIRPCGCDDDDVSIDTDAEDAEPEHKELGAGDVVFMKGTRADNSREADALVHRSPLVPETEMMPRLIVQTDSIEGVKGYM